MGNLTTKQLSWFKIDPNQPRKSIDEEALRRLAESMNAEGQLQLVGPRPDGRLLWGERRFRAASLLLAQRDDANRGELERMAANIPIRSSAFKKQHKANFVLKMRRRTRHHPR
jgi:ParB-like chromosome segregation protein Spo0J